MSAEEQAIVDKVVAEWKQRGPHCIVQLESSTKPERAQTEVAMLYLSAMIRCVSVVAAILAVYITVL